MPPCAAFHHLPSMQPAEPEQASDDLPLSLDQLSGVHEEVSKTGECSAITDSPGGSDGNYVCDSAFESVTAKAKVMLFDEPPAVSLDGAGVKAATLVGLPMDAKSAGAEISGAKPSGAKLSDAKLPRTKSSGPKAGGAKAAGTKAVVAKAVGSEASGAEMGGAHGPRAEQHAQTSELSTDPSSGRLTEREKTIIVECWKEVQAKGKQATHDKGPEDDPSGKGPANEAREPKAKQKGGGFSNLLSRGQKGQHGESHDETAGEKGDGHLPAFKIPRSFEEMGSMNAKMIGADAAWIAMVISSFDLLVASVVNNDDPRLLCEVTLLAIRGNKGASRPDLRDFQVCMMTSMRALVPQRWNSEHENAWLHLWAIIEEPATSVMALPAKYEKAVETVVAGLGPELKHDIGLAVFDKMFKEHPKSENFFKQSNSRLCFIVAKAIDIAAQLFTNPDACVNEVLQLGLRHIMYRVPTDFFGPFAGFIADELEARCDDLLAAEGFRWSLEVVAYTMMRAVDEGSSPLLTAIAENNPKKVRKALSSAGRIDRAKMALHSETAAEIGKKSLA